MNALNDGTLGDQSFDEHDENMQGIQAAFEYMGVSNQPEETEIPELAAAVDTRPVYHHFLSFNFPALDLLPQDITKPYLQIPTNAHMRVKPALEPEMAGVLGTEFWSPLTIRSPFPPSPGENKFIAELIWRSSSPGNTTLRLVSFTDPRDQQLYWRLQLRDDPNEWRSTVFDLCNEEMNWILGHREVTWATTLRNLIFRTSDRAWHHVRERMKAWYSRGILNGEENNWPADHQWNSRPPRTAKKLFFARANITLDRTTAVKQPNQRVLNFRFNCGHTHRATQATVAAMTGRECATFRCTCGYQVFQQEDRVEFAFRKQLFERSIYLAKHSRWRHADVDIIENGESWEPYNRQLLDALKYAFESLSPPLLVCPAELSPVNFVQSRVVFKHYEDRLSNHDMTPMTATEMLEGMIRLAIEGLRKAGLYVDRGQLDSEQNIHVSRSDRFLDPDRNNRLPPAYKDWLALAAKRAISFLQDYKGDDIQPNKEVHPFAVHGDFGGGYQTAMQQQSTLSPFALSSEQTQQDLEVDTKQLEWLVEQELNKYDTVEDIEQMLANVEIV